MEELSDQFDASRSTGHLCAATVENFEQVSLILRTLNAYANLVLNSQLLVHRYWMTFCMAE